MNLEIDFLVERLDRENLISELQRVAAALGKTTLSRRDIDAHGRISSQSVCRIFGSFRHGVQAAGLTPARFTLATDQELCSILAKLWMHTQERFGRSPYRRELKTLRCPVSASAFTSRFGSWNKALLAAREYRRASVLAGEGSAALLTKPELF